MKTSEPHATFQLHIELLGVAPPIWRRIQVWEDTKLPQIHRIIQILFDWEDCHLHEFATRRGVYSVPDPEDAFFERKVKDERSVPLKRIANRVGDDFVYTYDFGDDWRTRVVLEAILIPEPDAFYPRCTDGARNGPPEDSGGPLGYSEYCDALSDPRHPEHDSMLGWRGPFDPEAFSRDGINATLKRTFYRRPAGQRAPRPQPAAPEVERLKKIMRAALRIGLSPERPPKKIPPGSTLPLELSDRERELILKHSFAEEHLTRRLRIVPPPGQPATVRYTLEELDDLSGYVASEANHAKDRKLEKAWSAIFGKITDLLDSHTDGRE
jgi:hypothetical protein